MTTIRLTENMIRNDPKAALPHDDVACTFSPGCPLDGSRQEGSCPFKTFSESTGTQSARSPSEWQFGLGSIAQPAICEITLKARDATTT